MAIFKRSGFWSARFIREYVRISLPIMLSNLMGSSLHIIDNIMIGSMGEAELASVALANQLSFVMRLTLFGISSGCAIFCSQYWGNNDVPGVRRTMGISLVSAITACALAAIAAVFLPSVVMRIYSPDPQVIELGGGYLRIVGISYIVVGASAVYNAANRSTERVRISMVSAVTSIALNTFLNWCLIFGKLGFPRMGVNGAALATAIATLAEAAIQIGWTYIRKYPAAARPRELKPGSWDFARKYYKIAVPVMLNEGIWALGYSAYSAVYGRISTQAVAAINVYGTVDQLVMAAIWGTMNAASVMVGKRIGAGDEDEAMLYAKRILMMGVGLALFMGILLLLMRNRVVMLFNISGEAKAMAVSIMGVSAFTMWARSFNAINVVGILRAGGDAVFSMLLDCCSIWFVGVPLAFLGGIVLGQPLMTVFIMVQAEELLKIFIGGARFRSRKWINNLVRDKQTGLEA